MDNLLFYEGDLSGTLDNHAAQIPSRVDQIDKDQLRATPQDDLAQYLCSLLEIQPLELYEDRAEMDQKETRVDVSHDRLRNPFGDKGQILIAGIQVTITIPYTGDPVLWKLRPSQWQSVFPRANVRQPDKNGVGYIEILITQPSDSPPAQVKQEYERELKSIRFYVDSQKGQVERFNASLPAKVKDAIRKRKERLKAHDGVAELLGLPLKRREGAPEVQHLPIKRKLVRPLPPPPKSGFKPEPGISSEDYEHILSVVRHEGRTFEATPKTYAVHDEEELRDILLAHLNGHYQGGATGETFRRAGKTDIRIEDQNRAAFVAECKIWRGPKELSAAVDQMLEYLTWRDCKAALIIFNKKNAKFSEILEKVPETMKTHPRFKKDLGQVGDGEWRYVFSSKEDESLEITVRVFVFNVYV